eukprot:350664-Chlamydomonas_euryale.AAC.5
MLQKGVGGGSMQGRRAVAPGLPEAEWCGRRSKWEAKMVQKGVGGAKYAGEAGCCTGTSVSRLTPSSFRLQVHRAGTVGRGQANKRERTVEDGKGGGRISVTTVEDGRVGKEAGEEARFDPRTNCSDGALACTNSRGAADARATCVMAPSHARVRVTEPPLVPIVWRVLPHAVASAGSAAAGGTELAAVTADAPKGAAQLRCERVATGRAAEARQPSCQGPKLSGGG